MLHDNCKSIQTLLLSRLNDVEEENRQLREQMIERHDAATARERELLDNVLALANPNAALAIANLRRSTMPTPSAELLARGSRQGPRRSFVATAPARPDRSHAPILRPEQIRYAKPGEAQDQGQEQDLELDQTGSERE